MPLATRKDTTTVTTPIRKTSWPVLLVALAATASAAVWVAAEATELDPRVGQAIVAFIQPLDGETR
jgi:hypothetical protein